MREARGQLLRGSAATFERGRVPTCGVGTVLGGAISMLSAEWERARFRVVSKRVRQLSCRHPAGLVQRRGSDAVEALEKQ